MVEIDLGPLETQILGELADTLYFGAYGGVFDPSTFDGPYVVKSLRELLASGLMTTQCDQGFIDTLARKLESLNHQDTVNLLNKYKGRGKIKWK